MSSDTNSIAPVSSPSSSTQTEFIIVAVATTLGIILLCGMPALFCRHVVVRRRRERERRESEREKREGLSEAPSAAAVSSWEGHLTEPMVAPAHERNGSDDDVAYATFANRREPTVMETAEDQREKEHRATRDPASSKTVKYVPLTSTVLTPIAQIRRAISYTPAAPVLDESAVAHRSERSTISVLPPDQLPWIVARRTQRAPSSPQSTEQRTGLHTSSPRSTYSSLSRSPPL